MMDTKNKKSKSKAIASFILGLTFWIPILNLIFGLFAIFLGVKALINIRRYPDKYGGKGFAIIGIVLASLVYLTYLAGLLMCLIGYKDICESIGLALLA
ncbi:hypothetical protein CMO83_03645 [Candidatus Woesearchaeota archaeon]|nr:hypothetical protein [Candidatus Woesearchaeota archaeon]